jgi:ABC-2 type transport system permease protein
MWQRIRSLLIKELLAVWRDPKSRSILFIPPTVQLLIFTFAATEDVRNVRLAIYNQDLGIHGRELTERFEAANSFSSVRFVRSSAEAAAAIDARDVLLVLRIPDDFSRDINSGHPAEIQLILDGRRSNAAQIVEGYAEAIVTTYNQELLGARAPPVQPPSAVVARIWFNPNQDAIWNTVPALVAILSALMGLIVTSLSVARERELGTFEQLLISPLNPIEIIIGKALPALLIGVTEASGMIAIGVFVIGVPLHGSLLLLYPAMVVFMLSVIGVGLFISSLAKTQQQAILGTFVFMVPSMLLSGFSSPIENMPDWLQTATLANPIRYFIFISKGVFLKDMPMRMVLDNLWPMIIIAAVTLSLATWLFRHRME